MDAHEKQLAKWTESGSIDGVFWLPGLDLEGPVTKLSPTARRDALHVRVKLLAATMRGLPESTFLVAATRLGGQHGYDAAGCRSPPFGGAVTGFVKTLQAASDPQALVKAVDFESGRQVGAAGLARPCLIEETLRDPGAVEIGHRAGARWTVALRRAAGRRRAAPG